MYRLTRRTRSPLLQMLFALAVLVRSLAVPGYMAGGMVDGSGWPVQLCPEGLGPAAVTLLFGVDEASSSHHHGSIDADSEHHSRASESNSSSHAEHCTLGGSMAPALVPGSSAALLAPVAIQINAAAIPSGAIRAHPAAFQARAPPSSLPVY